jgi:transcriptional regulator with XRE-family HTH domain
MERNYEINRRIRKLMGCNDKKPEAVADRAGIRRSTFSRIINEKRPVFADEIPHMAAALGCSIEELFDGEARESARDTSSAVDESDNPRRP